MRYRIAKIFAALAIGFVPLEPPEALPALPEDPRVHYETGGSEYARTVARLLPAALAQVEAAHGRPFRHPVTVGVYVTSEAFVAANGLGNPRSVGMTFLGRVMLSPALFSRQRQQLPALLTHELSHAHLGSWMSQLGVWRLPPCFNEGLAVMVSGGGGAEGVSEGQTRDAIRRGDHIAIATSNSLLNLGVIRYAQSPEIPDTSFRTLMAYRQAGMFVRCSIPTIVRFLHDTDTPGFARMMDAILDDRSFAEALTTGYGTDLQALWSRFAQASSTPQ